ncbi:interferon-induced protein with tetratricopeptide repeats 1-like [Hyperolius riggenbachi]|uniref:interferon-induced protein with tetratricopeptide repeats 1-like n=1 Tax=Hyperolius riggenbachi TaxID=752182 RepID=UPI0035A3B4BC
MSYISKKSLKDRLEKLQCHFTWDLLGEGTDIDQTEDRLYDQIVFVSRGYKHRMYNLLAYVKYASGDTSEAMLQLQKAEAQFHESITSEDTDVTRVVLYSNYAWLCYHQGQIYKGHAFANKVETIYESSQIQNILQLEIYSEQGWAYFLFTKLEKAAECFEKALKLDPENPELNSGYAMTLYRYENLKIPQNPPNRSIIFLDRALKLNPKDTVVKALLALKHQDLNNFAEGDVLIEQALQEEPESPYVLRYVAKYYRRKGVVEEAIVILKKAISLTPTSSVLHNQLGMCYKKLIAVNRKSAHEAKVKGEPTLQYRLQTDEALASALFHMEKAVELKKTSVLAYILLAELYIKAKEYQKAEEAFHKAESMGHITCIEKQELHLEWGLYEERCTKSDYEAIKHYKEVIKIEKPTKYRDYAIVDLKRIAEAMIGQNPENATGYGLLGFVYQQDEENELTAIRHYEKALQLDPDNKEYLEALAALQPSLG